jgi:hypothetical protein
MARGTLDDPDAIRPSMEIYCDRELPWVHLGDMQRFAQMLTDGPQIGGT